MKEVLNNMVQAQVSTFETPEFKINFQIIEDEKSRARHNDSTKQSISKYINEFSDGDEIGL